MLFRILKLSEVLLRYRENAIKLFDGMFAFAWHDLVDNSIMLARDSLGQKPLYYYHDNNETIYSSELSGITFLKRNLLLSNKNFTQFLKNGFYTGENTPFEKVNKLLPGHYLIIKDGNLNTIKYWNKKPSSDIQIKRNLSEEKIIHNFLDIFLNLVN